jgi:hypothetical protein
MLRVVTPAEEAAVVDQHFTIGFRDLFVRDIVQANAGDVRMGTFVLCAAFLDALSLAYSAGIRVKGGLGAKWERFVTDYFGPEYALLRTAYDSFRSKLCTTTARAGSSSPTGQSTNTSTCNPKETVFGCTANHSSAMYSRPSTGLSGTPTATLIFVTDSSPFPALPADGLRTRIRMKGPVDGWRSRRHPLSS